MNLAIKINGSFVDTHPNTTIRYSFQSPAFGDNVVMGDISQMINLPATATNRKIFEFLNMPEAYQALEANIYDCEVYSNGVKIVSGKFKLKKSSDTEFRGNIIGGMSVLKEMIKEMKLPAIDYGDDITLGANDTQAKHYLVAAAKSGYPTYNIVAPPIKNAGFFGDNFENESFNEEETFSSWGFVNNFLSDKFADFSGLIPHYNEKTPAVQVFCPLLYLKFVITKIFENYGFSVGGDWYDDSEISTLILNHLNSQNDSIWDRSGAPLSLSPDKLLPDIPVKTLLIGIKQLFNLGYFYIPGERKFYIEPLEKLLSNTIVDWTDKVINLIEINGNDQKSGFDMDYTWDGDDSNTKDFIKDLSDYTIKTAVNSIAHLPGTDDIGDVRYVVYGCVYYIYVKDDDLIKSWNKLSYPYQNLIIGDGATPIKSAVSPIPPSSEWTIGWDQDVEDYVMVQYKVPKLDQQGNSVHVANLSGNQFTARLVFYRGIYTDSRGYYYPLASSDAIDLHGNSTGNYTMQWDGEKGLYNQWWAAWNEFLESSKETRWNLRLSLPDILNLDMRKRIRIKSTRYLIKKLSIKFPFDGTVEAELVKITADTTENSTSYSMSVLAGDFANATPNNDFNNDYWNT
jgi:hypothetical protein